MVQIPSSITQQKKKISPVMNKVGLKKDYKEVAFLLYRVCDQTSGQRYEMETTRCNDWTGSSNQR